MSMSTYDELAEALHELTEQYFFGVGELQESHTCTQHDLNVVWALHCVARDHIYAVHGWTEAEWDAALEERLDRIFARQA
jgi:hypothetical protein